MPENILQDLKNFAHAVKSNFGDNTSIEISTITAHPENITKKNRFGVHQFGDRISQQMQD